MKCPFSQISTDASLRSDAGITLVEIIIATVITALIGVTLVRITSDVANGLGSTVGHVVATNQTVSFARILRNDIGGAQDIYPFGANPAPADSQTYLCSSWDGVPTDWTDTTATNFTRPLFTIAYPSVTYDQASLTAPTYSPPSLGWIGYELRKATSTSGLVTYQLWRVNCADNSGISSNVVNTSRKLVDIGDVYSFDAAAVGAVDSNSPNGDPVLFCQPSTNLVNGVATDIGNQCAVAGVNASTSGSNGTNFYFQFKTPFVSNSATSSPGEASAQQTLSPADAKYSNQLTQSITRKIGN
jgi:hypothetical protein